MASGPCFQFTGEIPLDMVVDSVDKLKAEIAAHEATRPDLCDYYAKIRIATYGKPGHAAVIAWGAKRNELRERLEVAVSMAAPSYFQAPKKARPGNPRMERKSVEQLCDQFKATVEKMLACTDSATWNRLRTSANNTRHLIANRKGDSTPMPDLPGIPNLPRESAA